MKVSCEVPARVKLVVWQGQGFLVLLKIIRAGDDENEASLL